jgi:putative ABC transport system permease protein
MKADSFAPDLGARMPKEAALNTYYKHYSDALEVYGVLMFVGVFVGLLFIVATGGILYFRMAMEAAEDRERFVTLARIGMSTAEIRAAIAKGLAIIFGAPLVVAAANTLVAMTILERMVSFSMLGAYLVILAAYAGLYAMYKLRTLSKYVKTVADRKV